MQSIIEAWSFSIPETLKTLETKEIGLTEVQAKERLEKYGTNTFHNKGKKSITTLFLKQFLSPLIFLLIGAGILTGILSEWVDMGVIIFAVLLNVFLGFYHEYHAEDTLEKLTTYIKDRAKVIRDDREEEIDSTLLVPGDVVKLSYGARVPADVRIMSVNNFQVDEAILTGESLPVTKEVEILHVSSEVAERKNIAHAGTLVVQGYAIGVVYATGDHTEIGKIAGVVSSTKRAETPLQKGMANLAWFIFIVVIVIVIGILFLGIYRGEGLIDMLVLSTAVAVGAVPEALPITLTVILAIGALRIAEKRGVIRQLSAAETLGSTTLIMTDKTGTLTMAQMQLVGIHESHEILSGATDKKEQKSFSDGEKKLLELALVNIDVTIENKDEDRAKWRFTGRPLEANIARSAAIHGVGGDNFYSVSILALPFNSTNKFSVGEYEGGYVAMGAPDVLLKRSTISKEDYLKFEAWIEETSKAGKRLVGIATFPKRHGQKNLAPEDVKDLKFIGMLLFFDPIRKEVPEAIKNIETHGIKIILVTGDLPGTAISVAKDLGWQVTEDEVLTGTDLKSQSDEELLSIISKIKIFARVTPEDKLRIGRAYQSLGEVVAMTGDGVNDAPALKAMDIGISLGSGSDVAKSAADLVLLDDNFQTISTAVDEGHRILANVRKTVVYLVSNSLDEVFFIGGALLMGLPLPVTALQIIWVNLFTGSLPSLAFAFDENMDKRKLVSKESKIVFTMDVKALTFSIGVLSSLFLFFTYYLLVQNIPNLAEVRSIFFVCFASYILAITFSFRSLYHSVFSYPVFSNKKLNWSIVLALLLLIITMAVPFVRNIFDIAPLPLYSIPIILAFLAINVFIVEMAKWCLRKWGHALKFFSL